MEVKLNTTYKLVEACYNFLNQIEEKLQNEAKHVEVFSVAKIEEEKEFIAKLIKTTESN